jgi:hypothetical protein
VIPVSKVTRVIALLSALPPEVTILSALLLAMMSWLRMHLSSLEAMTPSILPLILTIPVRLEAFLRPLPQIAMVPSILLTL